MGKHPRSSSSSTTSISTATPSPQLLQKIRTLTGNHGCRDSEADRACTSPVSSVGETTKRKKEKRKNSLVDWEWEEWESEVAARKAGVIETTTGLLDSGFEIGERIGEKIPGYRVSAAFLSTLRVNLALATSLHPPNSPTSTASTMSAPPSLHSSATLPPPPSPLSSTATTTKSGDRTPSSSSSSTASENPLTPTDTPPAPAPNTKKENPTKNTTFPSHPHSPTSNTSNASDPNPPLTSHLATSAGEKRAALKLIADSLAQRRQTAAYGIIRSAPFLAVAVAILGALTQYLYTEPYTLAVIGTTFAGLMMVLFVGVRALSGGYLALAERVGWDWLGADEVLVSEWGTAMIGAVVFREEKGEKRGGRRRGGRGVVRAWTVRLRERGRGVGRGLVEEVCRVGADRGWDGVALEEGGLYDERVLPGLFHAPFERRAARGRAVWEEVWMEQGGKKRSR